MALKSKDVISRSLFVVKMKFVPCSVKINFYMKVTLAPPSCIQVTWTPILKMETLVDDRIDC
jgi:hypothetical protein